ncbi:agmatinase [Roseovarius sp. MBR-6]|jgi:agmatinase|uniref:agmatinase n=1 Tax=Roseovarius sp. MBR-6 TaxID=3156459 RepID=UPI0033946760
MTDSTSINPTASDLAFTRPDPRGTVAEPAYAGALSFMRRRYTRDLSGADVAVMGVPFDMSVSGRSGTRLGPRAIRAASAHIAWSAPWPWPFDPFERLSIVDYGDVFFDHGYPTAIPETIAQAARDVLATDTALLTLGGDHFITWPLLKAHAEKHGPLALIQIDAHSDTWEDEPGRIDHGTMLWHAVRDGLVVPEHSVQVGIRTHNPDPLGVHVIDAREVHLTGPVAVAARVRDIVGDRPCYLTFDIDALDPSMAPGTGTPVIGGLTTFQAQEILRGLEGIALRGMDMVEVAPAYDVSEITALAAATLACDMLALYASAR